jgi:hypothetical protein
MRMTTRFGGVVAFIRQDLAPTFHLTLIPITGAVLRFILNHPRYVREAVVLVRDPALNQTLYEAHAVSEGNSPGTDVIVGALFKAAMVDFPHTGVNPRPVVITIAPPPAAASAASSASQSAQ